MSSLLPLVTFLRTLPLPSTHPSHPAASAILNTLKDAQRGYADMRGNWSRKALEMHSRRVVDRAETLDGVAAGKEFGTWIDNLLKVAEVLFPAHTVLFCKISQRVPKTDRIYPPHGTRSLVQYLRHCVDL
jgi:hypothetical protein